MTDLVYISSKRFFHSRFYLLWKTKKSRRVAELRLVYVDLRPTKGGDDYAIEKSETVKDFHIVNKLKKPHDYG